MRTMEKLELVLVICFFYDEVVESPGNINSRIEIAIFDHRYI